jgi:hypothetical protein
VDAWLTGGDGDDLAYAAALTPNGLWLAGRFSSGPLGYALLVPSEEIPGVPLPDQQTPQPTATLAATATPQPTETLLPTSTATLIPTATAANELTETAMAADEEPTEAEAIITGTPSEADLELGTTRTVEAALTQGTPAEAITTGTETPPLTATPGLEESPGESPDDSGIPTGLLVGGGLLLAGALGGAVYFINRKIKKDNMEL